MKTKKNELETECTCTFNETLTKYEEIVKKSALFKNTKDLIRGKRKM